MKFFKYFLYFILYSILGVGGIFIFKMYASENPIKSQFKMMPISEQWEVVSVSDGDTIKASKDGKTERFRLCGIDAPETSQPLGKDSGDYLRSLLEQPKASLISHSNKVSISISDTDRYGRKIAEIFVINGDEEKFINEELVKAGLAYHYKQYSRNCPNRISLENAEAIAKSKGLGVWNGNHTPPWEYRRNKRKN